jgi:APA family basic amino acid/polyamine antiporter
MKQEIVERRLGLGSAIAIVVATIIGSGIFTTTGQIGPGLVTDFNVLAVWVVCAFLALCGALTIGELSAMLPHSGGGYTFVNRGFGRKLGCFVGLQGLLFGYPVSIAIISLVMGGYLNGILPWCPPILSAGVTVVLITAINCRGTIHGAIANNLGTVLKVGLITAFIIGGLWVATPESIETTLATDTPAPDPPGLFSAVFAAAIAKVIFAFNGWGAVAVVGGEVKRPERNLPLSILLSIIACTVIYILINIVFLRSGSPTQMVDASGDPTARIGYFAAERLFPAWAADSLALIVVIILISTLLSVILTGGRWGFAMAWQGQFPETFARRNAGGAPAAALILQCVLSLGLLVSFSVGTLLLLAGITGLLNRSMIIASVIPLRAREPDLPRPFRTPLYPLTPLIFIGLSLWIIWRTILADMEILVTSSCVIALVLVITLIATRRQPSLRS